MVIYPKWMYLHICCMPNKFVIHKKKYNRIKQVLETQERTQTWLAEQIDMDFVTITRYVNNHRQPTIPVLFELAKILKVNPKDLINS